MADPYLERLEKVLPHVHDLHEAAQEMGVDYASLCLTFNNGLRKGYWKIVVNNTDPIETL